MIHTFSTREEAAIFCSAMRSEGYFAVILDEGMGSIYGPLAIGGIRVLVSEERSESEPDETSQETTDRPLTDPPAGNGEFRRTVRFFTVGLVALGLVVLVISILAAFSQAPGTMFHLLVRVFGYVLVLVLTFAVLGPWMGSFTRWLRGERESGDAGCLRWVVLALITAFVLLIML